MDKFVIRKAALRQGLKDAVHPLNPQRKRATRSLGDATGLSRVGIHYVEIKPGITSTEKHAHRLGDEFIFVLSGTAILQLDGESIELAEGDFVGLPAQGPAHCLTCTGESPFVYLIGGDRPTFDVCLYPDLRKRVYLYFEGGNRKRDFVDDTGIDTK